MAANEDLPMDQQVKIVLSPEKFDEFVELLERPVTNMPKLKATMARKAPWD